MKEINVGALIRLKAARPRLSFQQYRTLRGQVLAGDPDGAMKGLQKLLTMDKEMNLTDKELIESLHRCACGYGNPCEYCELKGDNCCNELKIIAANRLEELLAPVEQKCQCFTENGKNPGEKQEPTKATEYISISLQEYAYLRNLDVLMDILLGDGDYSTFRNVVAVRQSIRDLKERRKVAAQE